MRNLLAAFLFFFVTIIAHGQMGTYHPFPDSNAVWHWGCGGPGFNCCCSCGGMCLNETRYQDSLAGDTVIASYTYQKVMTASIQRDYYTGPVTCAPWGYQTTVITASNYSYRCAIRQDTALRKIYMNIGSSTQDTLLYDFNLNLGDTLPPSAITGSEYYFVSKVDSILVGGKYHKRFWLWNITATPPTSIDSGNVAFIEGIGNTFGLFSALFEPFEITCALECVAINGIAAYPNSFNYCSSLNLSVGNNDDRLLFSLYPNPFFDQTTLQTDGLFKGATLTVYNVYGQNVRHICNLSGQAITIGRDNLPSGLYLLQLAQEGKILATEKIMVADKK